MAKEKETKKTKTKKVEKKVEEAPKKKKIWKKIIAAIIILAILIYVFFFLAFKVTFKYNNGEEDKIIKVKFLRKIPEEEIVKEPKAKKGYTFAGYAETYFLNGEQISTIKNYPSKEKDICKPDFYLDSEKVKCISEYEFDFENTRIWKNTTIEALWSKEGKKVVKKVKKKATPKKEETPVETKDEGTISLSASDTCMVGKSVTVTATLNDAKDSTITWSGDDCISVSGSGNSITASGNSCTGVVTAKLNNGASNSIKITFEGNLDVTLVDYEGHTPSPKEGYYYGVKTIKTNMPAYITGSVLDKSDSLRTSASTSPGADGTVTIKTPCGQSKTLQFKAVIN